MTPTIGRGLLQLIPEKFRPVVEREPLLGTPYARAILYALQGKHVYQCTVPDADKARRRARNRAARKARKTTRRNG